MAPYISDRELHEECGVFGIFGVPGAASLTYYGLHALQHRGQEGCGIVSVDDRGALHRVKGSGLVTEVFNEGKLAQLPGGMAIGHVRYTTAGGGGIENIQPFLFRHNSGDFALAHNGNIVNSEPLREYLESRGSLFQSTSDSEILAHLIKKETKFRDRPRIYAIIDALNMLEGAFAFVIMTANRIYACRDKYGLRPLSIGRLGDGWVVSSETCAFDTIGAEYVRDVEPGEVVRVNDEGLVSSQGVPAARRASCIFEYVYFARPDSVIDGQSVYQARRATGHILAKEAPVDADLVLGVPDSGVPAALGYAAESGIKYTDGIVKNRYVGRTFIQPTQEMRQLGIRLKLNPLPEVIRGKRLIVIDDSIVRGNTSKKLVQMLRDAGASEVHLRITSPEVVWPCFYGIDTDTREQLIAANMSVDEMNEWIGSDSLAFLSLAGLHDAVRNANHDGFCDACFTGDYPVGTPMGAADKQLGLFEE